MAPMPYQRARPQLEAFFRDRPLQTLTAHDLHTLWTALDAADATWGSVARGTLTPEAEAQRKRNLLAWVRKRIAGADDGSRMDFKRLLDGGAGPRREEWVDVDEDLDESVMVGVEGAGMQREGKGKEKEEKTGERRKKKALWMQSLSEDSSTEEGALSDQSALVGLEEENVRRKGKGKKEEKKTKERKKAPSIHILSDDPSSEEGVWSDRSAMVGLEEADVRRKGKGKKEKKAKERKKAPSIHILSDDSSADEGAWSDHSAMVGLEEADARHQSDGRKKDGKEKTSRKKSKKKSEGKRNRGRSMEPPQELLHLLHAFANDHKEQQQQQQQGLEGEDEQDVTATATATTATADSLASMLSPLHIASPPSLPQTVTPPATPPLATPPPATPPPATPPPTIPPDESAAVPALLAARTALLPDFEASVHAFARRDYVATLSRLLLARAQLLPPPPQEHSMMDLMSPLQQALDACLQAGGGARSAAAACIDRAVDVVLREWVVVGVGGCACGGESAGSAGAGAGEDDVGEDL